MIRTANRTLTAALCALWLGGCAAADNPVDASPSTPATGAVASAQTPGVSEPGTTSDPSSSTATTPSPTSPQSTGSTTKKTAVSPAPESPAAAKTGLSLTVGGKRQSLAPTDVYCSGRPGSIRRSVGKTSNRPPIIEVEGKRFVLVKTGRGAPYKAKSPTGVSYQRDGVTFQKVAVGSAVLDGVMACTKYEN